MILNERALRLVVTLAEELHFSRAAAALHLSQPALSGTLKALERDLGVKLFRRTSRTVELTQAGQVLVTEANRLIVENERVVALVRGTSPDSVEQLRIGYPSSINLQWMGSLICDARKESPRTIALEFVSAESFVMQEELLKKTLDVILLTGQVCHPNLHCETLFRESFKVVLGSGHPLIPATSLTLNQLRDQPVVWLCHGADPLLYDNFNNLCSSQGYRPKIVQEVRTFSECLSFAREGVGITFLPAFMESRGDDGSAVFVCLPEGTLHVDYNLAYRRSNTSEDVEHFVRFAKAHFESPSGPAIDQRL